MHVLYICMRFVQAGREEFKKSDEFLWGRVERKRKGGTHQCSPREYRELMQLDKMAMHPMSKCLL